MFISKKFRRMITAATVGALTFSPSLGGWNFNHVARAEIKVLTGTGEYVMSDFENPDIAKQRAKARAERNAQEQAGVFVSSYSKVHKFKLLDDEIITIASGVFKVLDVQYHREFLTGDEGILYRATIQAQIDSDDVKKWLDKGIEQRSMINSQLDALKKANAEQEKIIADLKAELSKVENSQGKARLVQKIISDDNIFLSNQKLEEALKLDASGDSARAVKFLTEAIDLNPKNDYAYLGRGIAYSALQKYQQAVTDFNTAIRLNPNLYQAYNNLGNIDCKFGKYEQAIIDYTKAIEVNPNYDFAYNNRGSAYAELGRFNRALEDFTKAIEIDPNYAEAFYNRGNVYIEFGDYQQALEDFTKAVEVNPNYAVAFNNRGELHIQLGNSEPALEDFTKAIEINPNYAEAFYNRGSVYFRLKDFDRAKEDYDIAVELNPIYAEIPYAD